MRKQKDMEAAMMLAHREFINGLNQSIDLIDEELKEATEMGDICNDEWCMVTESLIDDIHKQVYSISEPRFASPDDSRRIKELRRKVKNMYVTFKGISHTH